jgi:hypothetical protein
LIGTLTIAVCASFLIGQPGDLPMDDSYVHLQYADNLVKEHQLVFNPGEFTGIGSTSILWVLLLAGFKLLGVPTLVAAKALGMASFVVAAWCVFELGRSLFDRLLGERGDFAALVGACLFVFSGNMIWFALSGMETMLFLALGLLALTFYQSEQFGSMAVCLALMTLTRTEGVVLAAVILAIQLLRTQRVGKGNLLAPIRRALQRRYPQHARAWFGTAASGAQTSRQRARAVAFASLWRVLATCLLFFVLIAPWFVFVYHATGHPLPTSFSGKKLSQMAGIDHFLTSRPYLAPLVHLKPLVFVGMWMGYLAMHVFGGSAIPGPSLPVGRFTGLPEGIRLSVIALTVVLGVMVPLFVRGLAVVKHWWLSAVRSTAADRAVLALFVWVILHNLAYMILFPSMGTTTRYQAINHLIVWLLLAAGVFSLRERKRLFVAGLSVVAAVAVLNVGYWRGMYAANMDHMHNVRIASSEFLDRTLPKDAVIAAHDIGAIRYYCSRHLVDLGGLIDANFVDYKKRNAVDEYLLSHRVSYLVIPGKHSTEAKPPYDFVEFFGLWHSPSLTLRQRWFFENSYEVWGQGAKATFNYLPSVTIYEVVPKAQ